MERAIRLLGVVYQHPAAEQQEICSKRWMDSAYKGHWYRMAESLGAAGGWGGGLERPLEQRQGMPTPFCRCAWGREQACCPCWLCRGELVCPTGGNGVGGL